MRITARQQTFLVRQSTGLYYAFILTVLSRREFAATESAMRLFEIPLANSFSVHILDTPVLLKQEFRSSLQQMELLYLFPTPKVRRPWLLNLHEGINFVPKLSAVLNFRGC